MNDTLLGLMPILVIGFIAFIVLVVLIRRWLVNVGAREIAIKERRYIGAKMPPGRVVATEGEVGIQADVLKPGLHLVKWPFEKVVRKVPLIEIGTLRTTFSKGHLTKWRPGLSTSAWMPTSPSVATTRPGGIFAPT